MADIKKIFGIKGFDDKLCCRGFQYEIGKVYEMAEQPKLCKIGYHYCKNIDDCYNHYSNTGNNKYCIVEILGSVDEGTDKSCTNKLKIVRELTYADIKYKGIISVAKMKELCDMGYVIGGSMALVIHGYHLEREITDLDLIVPQATYNAQKIASDFNGHASLNRFSGMDSIFAYRGLMGEKYDILKSDKVVSVERVYKDVKLTVQDENVIWEAKLKYALNGSLKHMNDIKKCNITFAMLNKKTTNYDCGDGLPF